MIKTVIKTFIGLALIFGAYFFILNIFSYVDIPNKCYINLENDVSTGNQKTTRNAIKMIKREDIDSYKSLCKYVKTISEKNCYTIGSGRIAVLKDGCYVKGSKNIYIKPDNSDSDESIKKKSDLIKELASYSKNFWTSD